MSAAKCVSRVLELLHGRPADAAPAQFSPMVGRGPGGAPQGDPRSAGQLLSSSEKKRAASSSRLLCSSYVEALHHYWAQLRAAATQPTAHCLTEACHWGLVQSALAPSAQQLLVARPVQVRHVVIRSPAHKRQLSCKSPYPTKYRSKAGF
eukprot:4564922-Amphidinium_carterae.2